MPLQLPVTNEPAQDFVTLLGSTRYEIYLRWNDRAGFWTMDVTDYNSQTKLLSGVPVLLGCNLFGPYNLNNGVMMAYDTTQSGTDSSYDDFGTRVLLLWLSDSEVADLAGS